MSNKSTNKVHISVIIIASLMLFSGLGETVVVFLTNSNVSNSSILLYILGFSYIFGGILIFLMRKWSFIISIIFLFGNIVLRIIMLFTGIYPTSTAIEIFGYIFGISFSLFFLISLIIQIKKAK